MINTRIDNSAWNGLLPLRALDELDQTTFMSRCRSGVVSRRELEVFLVRTASLLTTFHPLPMRAAGQFK